MASESMSSLSRRVVMAALLTLMVVGAFALWIGVPAAILWGLGALVSDRTEHLALGLLAVPAGMVLFGILLGQLNAIYLRAAGSGTLSGEGENPWMPRLQGPLGQILGVCAVIALLALLAWMIFGASATGPVSPW